jgi:hypothetical protein
MTAITEPDIQAKTTIEKWLQLCNVSGGQQLDATIAENPGKDRLGVKFESLEPAGLLRVKSLESGFAMGKAGVVVGDVLLSINGQASNHDNVSSLLRYPARMSLLRGSSLHTAVVAGGERGLHWKTSLTDTERQQYIQQM